MVDDGGRRVKAASFRNGYDVGGEGGIRTHGPLARSTVFETAPFDHSGTSPNTLLLRSLFTDRLVVAILWEIMAEREGFEPSVELPLHTLSRRAPSATRTPLQ